jgi:hypothetical protein
LLGVLDEQERMRPAEPRKPGRGSPELLVTSPPFQLLIAFEISFRALSVPLTEAHWNATMLASAADQLSVEKLLSFVQNRRVLYARAEELTRHDARVSVQKIAEECAYHLSKFEKASSTAMAIDRIARACSHFLGLEFSNHADFYMAVGALRAIVAEPIMTLSAVCRD